MASEIHKPAIACTLRNFPQTAQLGDVVRVREMAEAGFFGQGQIDLLIGGSPCQGFSSAGAGLNFADPRSALFFEYVRIKNAIKPKRFLLENVRMKKEWCDVISAFMGVQPVFIDSADFSAQTRKRLYWSDIPVAPWVPVKTTVQEIVGSNQFLLHLKKSPFVPKSNQRKAGCLNGAGGNACGNHSEMDVLVFHGQPVPVTKTKRINLFASPYVRRFSIVECERLQTLPDGYTNVMTDSAAFTALSNGWTVDVIAHIFKGLTNARL